MTRIRAGNNATRVGRWMLKMTRPGMFGSSASLTPSVLDLQGGASYDRCYLHNAPANGVSCDAMFGVGAAIPGSLPSHFNCPEHSGIVERELRLRRGDCAVGESVVVSGSGDDACCEYCNSRRTGAVRLC